MEQNLGNLSVRTYTAGGGLPVSGAFVRILGAEESNREVVHSLVTDKDGNTPSVALPAPNRQNSLTPDGGGETYALYNIEAEKDGFYTKKIFGVTVFSGVNSLQLINMIPISTDGTDYPRGNINTLIPENEIL